MPEDWSLEEVNLITEDYFAMLKQELRNVKYNKTDHRRSLLPLLDNRSEGSIEFKHQNISAVLFEMHLPFIKGYKRRDNYQDILFRVVSHYIELHHDELDRVFTDYATQPVPDGPAQPIDYSKVLDTPPEPSVKKSHPRQFKPFKKDFSQLEQQNRVLGVEGEEFVLEYEKWRLQAAGHPKLADLVKRDSIEKGDGLGYDVISKNEDGTNRHIEVKTTKLSKESPFYVSANEVAFAAKHPDSFFLYRVFDAASHKRLFIQQGPYDDFCRLEPVTYRGIF